MFSRRILLAWGVVGCVCAAIGATSLVTSPATVMARAKSDQGKFLSEKPMGDNHLLSAKPMGDNHFLSAKPMGSDHIL